MVITCENFIQSRYQLYQRDMAATILTFHDSSAGLSLRRAVAPGAFHDAKTW